MKSLAEKLNTQRRIYKLRRLMAYTFKKNFVVEKPVFILGCGRSGTTILGEMLSNHEQILYLNEPREIWLNDPRTNIWNAQALEYGGQLCLTRDCYDSPSAKKIRRAFEIELKISGKTQLVEKLPINSFRINYIRSIFPDAKFIHMIRNGVEVAHSISALYAKTGRWFGHDGYKWKLLSAYASSRGEGDLVKLCSEDTVLRGLLEWYLSVCTTITDLEKLDKNSWIEIRYENLLKQPVQTCEFLESFLGLPHSLRMSNFAATQIHRKTPKKSMATITPEMQRIGGHLLKELQYL